jgi:DNA-binding LytR/AlgR family response regulator
MIADDEAPMRDLLRARLAAVWPELRIVAEAANGVEAVALGEQHQPDIAFLDIRMPGMSGIEAARQLYKRSHIVFATAYDQYALDAFEQGATRLPAQAGECGAPGDHLRAPAGPAENADAGPPAPARISASSWRN